MTEGLSWRGGLRFPEVVPERDVEIWAAVPAVTSPSAGGKWGKNIQLWLSYANLELL